MNYKATARDAIAHLGATGICSGVLFLFVALTYSRIALPRYTTHYTEKDVQQVVNLIITVVATVIGILFSHCRRLTNEAETKSELRDEKLTIPRLHVHFEAASGSKVAMGIPVIRNKQVWRLVAFYFAAMIIFAFVHSVLSVIFVIEAVISDKGEPVPVAIPLSVDVPYKVDGVVVDPCDTNLNDPGCTYILALQALASQLVSYQDYSIAGVTFSPPNGTMGLPYYAMEHFQKEVALNKFEDARRRYCLPVLDPQIIKCTEVLINGTTCESDDGFVRFKSLSVSSVNEETNHSKSLGTGLYKITSPFPNDIDAWGTSQLRMDTQGKGVMVLQTFQPDPYVTLVGAANAWADHGYASMLHRLMYDGENPDMSGVAPGGTYDFAARCELTAIQYEDDLASSWRQVDFTLNSGVLHANVTDERCPNARGPGYSGFTDLQYALDLAGAIISSTDGYSKFFNEHPQTGSGTQMFANMSRLDAIVNQVYHIVQTGFTQSSHQYSMEAPAVHNNPITMLNYPHLFIIRISWTPTTYIGLVLSLLIALNAYVLAVRWAWATFQLGIGGETWNLLRPIDLMAYSLAASQDLLPSLDTSEHRKLQMRGTLRTVLRERPLDLLRFMNRAAARPTTGSESEPSTSSPARDHEEKAGQPVGPGVSVRERHADLERET